MSADAVNGYHPSDMRRYHLVSCPVPQPRSPDDERWVDQTEHRPQKELVTEQRRRAGDPTPRAVAKNSRDFARRRGSIICRGRRSSCPAPDVRNLFGMRATSRWRQGQGRRRSPSHRTGWSHHGETPPSHRRRAFAGAG